MTEEFNLSDKVHSGSYLAHMGEFFYKQDVKEFIKELKDAFYVTQNDAERFVEYDEFCSMIAELAGEKLLK